MTKTIEIGDLVKIVKLNKTAKLYSLDHNGWMKEMVGKEYPVEISKFDGEGVILRYQTRDITFIFAIDDLEIVPQKEIYTTPSLFDPNDLFI
jgi:hypothetical protein